MLAVAYRARFRPAGFDSFLCDLVCLRWCGRITFSHGTASHSYILWKLARTPDPALDFCVLIGAFIFHRIHRLSTSSPIQSNSLVAFKTYMTWLQEIPHVACLAHKPAQSLGSTTNADSHLYFLLSTIVNRDTSSSLGRRVNCSVFADQQGLFGTFLSLGKGAEIRVNPKNLKAFTLFAKALENDEFLANELLNVALSL